MCVDILAAEKTVFIWKNVEFDFLPKMTAKARMSRDWRVLSSQIFHRVANDRHAKRWLTRLVSSLNKVARLRHGKRDGVSWRITTYITPNRKTKKGRRDMSVWTVLLRIKSRFGPRKSPPSRWFPFSITFSYEGDLISNQINTPTRVFYMVADSDAERDDWIKAIHVSSHLLHFSLG